MPGLGLFVGRFSFPLRLLPLPQPDTEYSLELPVSLSLGASVQILTQSSTKILTGFGTKYASPKLEGMLRLILTRAGGSAISDLISLVGSDSDGMISINLYYS